MGKEYIPLFLDFNETTQDLTDEECGRLVRAIVDYANDLDYEKRLSGSEMIAFRFLKGLVDRNAAISEKRAKARSGKNNTEQNETNDNKTEQNESKSAIETKTETDIKTKNKNKDIEERFDRFWSVYPRKTAKVEARKKFDKLNPDEELLNVMINAVQQQKQSEQWTKDNGQYIPHPATWIHQRRWEDETTYPKMKVLPAQQYDQRDYSGVQAELMAEQDREMEEYMKKESG